MVNISLWPRVSNSFLPTRLRRFFFAGIGLLTLLGFGMTSAAATTSYTLPDSEWVMLSLPADPGGTFESAFEDDLPVSAYNSTWVIFSFDPIANRYVNIPLSSSPAPAVGYWIIQITGDDVTIDLPPDATPFATTASEACPSSNGCVEVPLRMRPGQPTTWNFVGYSGQSPMAMSETRFGTSSVNCSDGCTSAAAENNGLLRMPLYHYAGSSAVEPYELVTSASDLIPWYGYWAQIPETASEQQLRWLQPQPLLDNSQLDPDNPTQRDAARLLTQATFGPTESEILRVADMGPEQWIEEQFTLQGPPHLDIVLAVGKLSDDRARNEAWWLYAIDGQDQLRQRVAFALSEIFVLSDIGTTLNNAQYGVTHFYDQLREGAFGNYRDLLETITLSPVMGTYLSMRQNSRGDAAGNTRPDENFAREVMQLFSIGLHELLQNGTVVENNNVPVPAYTQSDVESYARVYTGWNFAGATRWDNPYAHYSNNLEPMTQFPGYHDTGAKQLLGGVISPAGISAEQDLDNALDSLANHSNVGPFFGRQLIQRLVTSNPTPAYVGRVAAVFADNGQGVRGDLAAVVKAILLDSEARDGFANVSGFGKLREPLLTLSHVWRAFDVSPGSDSVGGIYHTNGPALSDIDSVFGQAVLKSKSVFNFFHPDYAPVGAIQSAGLDAPEAEIYTDENMLAGTTFLNSRIQSYYAGANDNGRKTAYVNLEPEIALAGNSEALLDRLDLLLLNGAMTNGMRMALLDHMAELSDTPEGHSLRTRDIIMLILMSPEYRVQK